MLLVGHRLPPHAAHVGRSPPSGQDVERLDDSPTDANVGDVARGSLGLKKGASDPSFPLSPPTPSRTQKREKNRLWGGVG